MAYRGRPSQKCEAWLKEILAGWIVDLLLFEKSRKELERGDVRHYTGKCEDKRQAEQTEPAQRRHHVVLNARSHHHEVQEQ